MGGVSVSAAPSTPCPLPGAFALQHRFVLMPRVISVSSEEEWDKHISETKGFGGKSAVVDFTASCRMIGPHFEKMSDEFPTVTFLKVDVDDLQDVARAAGITAMPTFQAYFNGQKVDSMTGADPAGLRTLIQGAANRVMSGAGRKVGGDAPAAAAPDSADERRKRMAEAAEARAKATQS